MARERKPSGLPSDRIVRPVYGPNEIDVDRRVGNQHEGFRRVRRTLLVVAVVLAALVLLVLITGNTASASGIVIILLAPVVFVLVCVHLAVVFTEPKPPAHGAGGS